MKHIILLAVFLLGFAVPAGTMNIPRIDFTPNSDAAIESCWDNLEWHGNFRVLGSKAYAPVQTRFKVFHNNAALHFLIECDEPNMNDLVHKTTPIKDSEVRWHDDSLEIGVAADPQLLSYMKLILNCDGASTGHFFRDNNTDGKTFFSVPYKSAQTLVFKNAGKWYAKVSIPFYSLELGDLEKVEWRIYVGRNRYAGGKKEFSSSVAISPGHGHTAVREYQRAELQNFDLTYYKYLILPKEKNHKTVKLNNTYVFQHSPELFNKTGRQLLVKFRSTIRKNGLDISEKEQTVILFGNQAQKMQVYDELQQTGDYELVYEIRNMKGETLFFMSRQIGVYYDPLKIRIIKPCYRNAIFSTMQDKSIEAEIRCEEPGKTEVVVKLQKGNEVADYKKLSLKNGKARYYFNAAGLSDGRYELSASFRDTHPVRCIIRKLPFRDGEFWMNESGGGYVNGKPFVPFGWFHSGTPDILPADSKITAAQEYHRPANLQETQKYLAAWTEAGIKVMFWPYPDWNLFAGEKRHGKMTAAQKENLKSFSAIAANSPGFLAYYLADEPENNGHGAEWYVQVRELLDEIDPYHPCIIVNQNFNSIRHYKEGCDITLPDCYPTFFEDGTTYLPLWRTSKYASEAASLMPTWFAPQAYGSGSVHRTGKVPRPPDFDQLRNQVYQALAHDAKGIFLYSFLDSSQYYLPMVYGPKFIGHEIDAIKEYIVAPLVKGKVHCTVTPKDAHFQFGLKQVGKDFLLIAVNPSGKKIDATFKLNFANSGKWYVMSEKRAVECRNNVIRDTFENGAVHIYATDKRIADLLDVNQCRKKIADAENARFMPGNILATGRLPFYMYCQKKLSASPDFPKITSSAVRNTYFTRNIDNLYFLFDGIKGDSCKQYCFSPYAAKSWLEITLPEKREIGKIAFYAYKDRKTGKYLFESAEIFCGSGDKMVHCGTIRKEDNREKSECSFSPVPAQKIRFEFTGNIPPVLTEIEAYEK